MRAIFDHSNFAIFIVEIPSGRILYSNAYVTEKLKYGKEPLGGMTIYEIFGEGVREDITKTLEALPGKRGLFISEVRSADDEKIPCEVAFTTATIENDSFVIFIIRVIDESGLKKRSEHLKSS